jgi:RimJ/RimL family protein N-acetyltransferase
MENAGVDWPLKFPAGISEGAISARAYAADDAVALFDALRDERAWEHMPHAIPLDAAELDIMIQIKLVDGLRATLVIHLDQRVVGMTSALLDPTDPDGVEVGGTHLDPAVGGTAVNGKVKHLLFTVIFAQGAQGIQLRTDERNGRSAAAIRKLGARDLGIHQDHRIQRDGAQRRSRLLRVDRPANQQLLYVEPAGGELQAPRCPTPLQLSVERSLDGRGRETPPDCHRQRQAALMSQRYPARWASRPAEGPVHRDTPETLSRRRDLADSQVGRFP